MKQSGHADDRYSYPRYPSSTLYAAQLTPNTICKTLIVSSITIENCALFDGDLINATAAATHRFHAVARPEPQESQLHSDGRLNRSEADPEDGKRGLLRQRFLQRTVRLAAQWNQKTSVGRLVVPVHHNSRQKRSTDFLPEPYRGSKLDVCFVARRYG